MNNFTELLIVIAYLLLAGAFAAVLFTAMIFNMRQGEMVRKRLAENLETLRMGKMLKAVGIDINEYLHQEPTKEVKSHMRTCASCIQTDLCDQNLDGGKEPDDTSYCPNDDYLREMRERQAHD